MAFESIKPGDETKEIVGLQEAPDGFEDDYENDEQRQASETITRKLPKKEMSEEQDAMRAETQAMSVKQPATSRDQLIAEQREKVQQQIDSSRTETVETKKPVSTKETSARAQTVASASKRVKKPVAAKLESVPQIRQVDSERILQDYTALQEQVTDPKRREELENKLARRTAQEIGIPSELAELLVSKHRRYLPLGFVGKGGMGVVIEAKNLNNPGGPNDVIKFLFNHKRINPEALERFRHEAVAQANLKLKNNHIIDVRDAEFDRPDFGYFMVLEKAEGSDLRNKLKERGALSPQEAVTMAEQIMGGLAAMHERNVIHRDIKPENIFIHREELQDPSTGEQSIRTTYRLGDFGLVKYLPTEELVDEWQDALVPENEPERGTIHGTPFYMAPEQLSGDFQAVYHSDTYELGHTLYELLTGVYAFKKESESMSELIQQVSQHEIVPLRERVNQLGLKLPENLVSLVDDMMAAKPEDRPSDQEVLERLAEIKKELKPDIQDKPKKGTLKKRFLDFLIKRYGKKEEGGF